MDLLEGEDYYNSYKIVFSYEDTVFEEFPSISCKEINERILNELKYNYDFKNIHSHFHFLSTIVID